MEPGRSFTLLLLSVLAVAMLCGCANWRSSAAAATRAPSYAVAVDSTPFYYRGPRQGIAADKTLSKDTLVTMIRHSLGWCKVRLNTGEEGYVANDDIRAASATLVAASNSPKRLSQAARFRVDSPEPTLLSRPESLPEFEPTPIPAQPNFGN